jgi:hypothetical protein
MLIYALDEPNPGLGFRLTASDSDFPNFFFSSREVADRTFVIDRRVFYKDEQKANSGESEPLGTDTKLVRAYQRAYAEAINYIDSLGLKFNNNLGAERLEYLAVKK